jgi:formate-dependent nitrite reductase cytochrome c552 subunit
LGSKTEAEIQEIGKLLRDGQFYFDFSICENSEGAHNSALTEAVLDKAEAKYKKAIAMLARADA